MTILAGIFPVVVLKKSVYYVNSDNNYFYFWYVSLCLLWVVMLPDLDIHEYYSSIPYWLVNYSSNINTKLWLQRLCLLSILAQLKSWSNLTLKILLLLQIITVVNRCCLGIYRMPFAFAVRLFIFSHKNIFWHILVLLLVINTE